MFFTLIVVALTVYARWCDMSKCSLSIWCAGVCHIVCVCVIAHSSQRCVCMCCIVVVRIDLSAIPWYALIESAWGPTHTQYNVLTTFAQILLLYLWIVSVENALKSSFSELTSIPEKTGKKLPMNQITQIKSSCPTLRDARRTNLGTNSIMQNADMISPYSYARNDCCRVTTFTFQIGDISLLLT